MHRSVTVLALSSVLGAAAFVGAAQIQQRTVYVSAADKKGVPVTGLRAQDLSLTEDGKARPILSVELARQTPKVAVVLDDRGAWNAPLRESVRTFLLALRDKAEVGLFSSATSEWTLVDFTRNTDALTDAIVKQVAVSGDGEHVETLMESLARRFGRDETVRPIIVVISVPKGYGPTISPRWDIVVKEVQKSRTTVFAIGKPDNNLTQTAAEVSGGQVDVRQLSTGLPSAMTALAEQILGQYAVTYESTKAPGSGMRLKVKPTRDDISVRAPERVF
jgi:hypothetical protein